MDGMAPRTFGSCNVAFRPREDLVLDTDGMGSVNWKGYECVLTIFLDMVKVLKNSVSVEQNW